MGRVKLPIKRIENSANRQVTFSKRRNGLIKKAYELAILCDIDIALIMFSPSGRLSHFSGKRRIEDVITRYVALSEHDRHGDIRNPEYLLSTLKKLKTENDMALQAANPVATQSNLELEFCNLQSQLQMAEEQLRMYEPDPLKFTSLEELESCEKNLIDTIARVEERKKCLLNNPIPCYDPSSVEMYLDSQEGLPNFENEITSWLPENEHNSNSVCVASESSCIPVSNQSTATVFDPLCHVSNVNMDHQHHHHHHHDSIGGSHMNNSNNGGDQVQDNVLPPWHQAFLSLSSTELLAAFMPPTSFSIVKQQHEVEGPSFTSMLQEEHQTETISLSNCPQMPSSTGEGSEYDSKLP